jgi:predicted negative regulator of RcsB-dependent stress response
VARSKLTRRELREEDEITSKLQSFTDLLISRRNEVVALVGVILAILIGVAAWFSYTNQNNQLVQAQLGRVTAALTEPLIPAAERNKKVIAEGEKMLAEYGSKPEANLAKYYMAFGHEGLGEVDKATAMLEDVSSHAEGDLRGMAQFGLAEIHARHGQQAKAIDILKELFEKGGYTKSAVALELARTYESASQPDQAKTYYEKVITEFGSSPLRSEAEAALRRMGHPIPAATARNPS